MLASAKVTDPVAAVPPAVPKRCPLAAAVIEPVNVGEAVGAREVSVGCLWSSWAHLVPVPTAAVPSTIGVAVPAAA